MTKPKDIRRSREKLQNPYAYLDDKGGFSADTSQPVSEQTVPSRYVLENPYAYLDGDGKIEGMPSLNLQLQGKTPVTATSPIIRLRHFHGRPAAAARYVQEEIWRNRNLLWPDGVPDDPVDMLDPEIAMRCIGYDVSLDETLGQYRDGGVTTEVAGTIDQKRKKVRISRRLPFVTRRFTAAHELGHAMMHKQTSMHRDRPVDGSVNIPRTRTEMEADKFASCFLMPENLVRNRFFKMFGTERFVLDDTALFMLKAGGAMNISENSCSIRDLSRMLASIQSYNGQHFDSLANQFHVSTEAMAIRLEELNLIDF